jgi:hypothetical protein
MKKVETTLLFVNLRRFNALLPSLALLLMAVAFAWAALTTNKPSPPKTVVPPGQPESLASDVLELRKLDVDLDLGPNLVMLKVVSKKKSGSAYDSSEIRNLVFVSDDSETMKWVFPTQDQELVSVHPLRNGSGEIKVIYVESVAKSSEVKASGFHSSSIYLVSADGSGLKKVLEDVDEIFSRRNDANKLRLIYHKQNSIRMAQIDMKDFRVLADQELAKMSEFKK